MATVDALKFQTKALSKFSAGNKVMTWPYAALYAAAVLSERQVDELLGEWIGDPIIEFPPQGDPAAQMPWMVTATQIAKNVSALGGKEIVDVIEAVLRGNWDEIKDFDWEALGSKLPALLVIKKLSGLRSNIIMGAKQITAAEWNRSFMYAMAVNSLVILSATYDLSLVQDNPRVKRAGPVWMRQQRPHLTKISKKRALGNKLRQLLERGRGRLPK